MPWTPRGAHRSSRVPAGHVSSRHGLLGMLGCAKYRACHRGPQAKETQDSVVTAKGPCISPSSQPREAEAGGCGSPGGLYHGLDGTPGGDFTGLRGPAVHNAPAGLDSYGGGDRGPGRERTVGRKFPRGHHGHPGSCQSRGPCFPLTHAGQSRQTQKA